MIIDECNKLKSGNADPYARYERKHIPGGEGMAPITNSCPDGR